MTYRTPEEYRACAEDGMTMSEAAVKLGRSYDAVMAAAKTHGITFKRAKCGRPAKRDTKITIIKLLRKAPRTVDDLSASLGVAVRTVENNLGALRRIGFAHVAEKIEGVAIWEITRSREAAE